MYAYIKKLPRKRKKAIVLGVDLSLIVISLFLAFCLQSNSLWPAVEISESWVFFPLLVASGGIISISLGIPAIKLNAYESRAVLKTGIFASFLALTGSSVNGLAGVVMPHAIFVIFGSIFFSLSVASRLAGLRVLLWIYRQGQTRTRVLIYGAGGTGVQLVAALGPSEEIEPVGFVDDNPTLRGMTVAGLPVDSPARILELVKAKKIDRVVLAMPSLSPPRQSQIAKRLESQGVDVHRLPSFSEIIGGKDLVDNLEPVRPSDYLGRSRIDSELPAISDAYIGSSVMITGAGGSIGSELCRQLLACSPTRLVIFEQSELALYRLNMELITLAEGTTTKIVPVIGSVCDPTRVQKTLEKHAVDIILHAAAYKHVPLVEDNEIEGLRNNILGTKVLADAARDAGIERFVLISTDKAVRPTNVMGASKRMSELVVQDLATRAEDTLFSMVRFGNVLGSSGSVIPLFADQIAKGGPITLTHNDVTRYFMTIPEAARLVLLAGSFARGGDVFVLDMGKQISIRELARQMIIRSGYSVRDETTPDGDIEIEVTGLRPGEKLYEELLIGADLQTTPHPKILRAQERMLSELETANMIKDLRSIVDSGDTIGARALMQRWVEGYKSPVPRKDAGSVSKAPNL